MATLTKDKRRKRAIRLEIGELLDQCSDCEIMSQNRQIYGVNEAYKMCADICDTGKKIKKLGQILG